MIRLSLDAFDHLTALEAAFCVFRDIIDELCLQNDRTDAVRIYVISFLRVC